MKNCKFKGSDEDIIEFIESLPKLIDPCWKTGLHVKLSGSNNRFVLALSIDSVPDMSLSRCDIGVMPGFMTVGVPALASMINEKHPKLLLRPGWMSIQEVVDLFGLDKVQVYREIFKALKTKLSKASRLYLNNDEDNGKFWIVSLSSTSKKFTNIHEMVMTASLG